ncbi:MAG: excinuclease ABC subunit UvrC, partial [Evtepia sp.]
EIGIQAVPALFAFIVRIQEETHNTAIEFHRKQRSKTSYGSTLEQIPGIGVARRTLLLRTFQSVKAIREADLDALLQVLPAQSAKAVYAYFRTTEEDSLCASSAEPPVVGG